MTSLHKDKEEQGKKLVGWKSIARHLGRSERAVQLWEVQRALPIHRIPGNGGQTVYAYASELDRWINGEPTTAPPSVVQVLDTIALEAGSPTWRGYDVRPPGILVLPVERRADIDAHCSADALCQQLIVRLAAVQPVRVLSWTTSRSIQQSIEPLEFMAARLNVRYLVESLVERSDAGLHVDIRVVDADFDLVMLADRFIVPDGAGSATYADLADGVALHFALIHAGALVERICLGDMVPRQFLHYLAAAQAFFDDSDGAGGAALASVNRALASDPNFVPAKALRGLVLLNLSDTHPQDVAGNEARVIFAACRNEPSARVTTAFLGAAIARRAGNADRLHESLKKMALRWVPPPSGREGRLYERRSSLRRRDGSRETDHGMIERRARATGSSHPLIDSLLRTLVAAHSHELISLVEQVPPVGSAIYNPTASDALGIRFRDGHDM